MKIGLFADPHYSSSEQTGRNRRNRASLQKLLKAYSHFTAAGCSLAVCLGDLIDHEPTTELVLENLSAVAEIIANAPMKTVALMGNHDAFALTPEQFYGTLGLPFPSTLSLDGRRLVFLDSCYFSHGRHYAPGDSNWKDAFLPNTEALAAELALSHEDTYLFLHHVLDPAVRADHCLSNADTVRTIIRNGGTVKAVFQGHFHEGARAVYDGVDYITLPAMCENENAYFVFEI